MNDRRTSQTPAQPDDLQRARQLARKRRRRKLMIIRTCIVLGILLLVALIVTGIAVKIVADQKSKRGEVAGFLGVKEIVVEGETRYTDEELIEASKLYVGQSLLSVNKIQAHDNLTAAFPYLNTVEVGNTSFYTLRIRVSEVPVMAVVDMGEEWMILGENNRALESVSEDNIPEGLVRIAGATYENQVVGKNLLDERSLRIVRTLISAAKRYQLDSMTTIDVSDKTKIFLMLNERMQVVLGNETNLATQVKILVDTLPTLYKNNGEDAAGRLDMIFYTDENRNNDKLIYTPQEVLDKLLEAKQEPMAAVKTEGTWTIINKDNVILESVPEEYLSEDILRVTGATYNTAVLGEKLLDKRSWTICQTLVKTAAAQEGVLLTRVDMTEKTAITIQLKEGLRILLGDSTALESQIKTLAEALPTLWEEHGKDATGVLDMTSYGDDDPSNDELKYTAKSAA